MRRTIHDKPQLPTVSRLRIPMADSHSRLGQLIGT
jgi:hypothetical protein